MEQIRTGRKMEKRKNRKEVERKTLKMLTKKSALKSNEQTNGTAKTIKPDIQSMLTERSEVFVLSCRFLIKFRFSLYFRIRF